MNPFIETISVAGALALAVIGTVIVLTLFYRALNWLSGDSLKAENLSVHGVFKKDTLVTVELSGKEVYERVYFRGYLKSGATKNYIPWELNEMIVLEDEQRQKIMIRAKHIRKIIIPPEAN